MSSHIPFSKVPRGAKVLISGPTRQSVAELFCPDGLEDKMMETLVHTGRFDVEAEVTALWTARTIHTGWVMYLATDEDFCPKGWTPGNNFTIYEDDDWTVLLVEST